MALTVGAVTGVNVVAGGHALRYEPTAPTVRGYTGELGTSRQTGRGFVRVWALRTPPMAIAELAVLEAELLAAGTVTVTGDLVGDGLLCHASNVRRHYDRVPIRAALSFELRAGVPEVPMWMSDGMVLGDAALAVGPERVSTSDGMVLGDTAVGEEPE